MRSRVPAGLLSGAALALSAPPAPAAPFGDDFWQAWGDGRAELASYDLVFPRYGELRRGTAVTIFVTETFSESLRVKADPGRHPASDEFPVMKLNLVQDFATGIYDYNLMTSAFVALVPHGREPAGSLVKVSFSAQEWCGHVWHQMLPEGKRVRSTLHSYFDGEADREKLLPFPVRGIFEDVLFHWARGLAAPFLEPGESVEVPLLRSPESARLRHEPAAWTRADLTRGGKRAEVTVPAGTFAVETLTARIADGPEWTFLVETREPRRIVRWERSDGLRADLVASERTKYWMQNDEESLAALDDIGLSPRPSRTP